MVPSQCSMILADKRTIIKLGAGWRECSQCSDDPTRDCFLFEKFLGADQCPTGIR